MSRLRANLAMGGQVLLPSGIGLVTSVNRDGYSITDAAGQTRDVAWTELTQPQSTPGDNGYVTHRLLSPWWQMLDERTRQQACDRLEVVQEIRTGFRDGHAALAREGEPYRPYGPMFGASTYARCKRMAEELTRERTTDRARQRRILRGELKDREVSQVTIRLWLRTFEEKGLLGLVDGRKLRRVSGFDVLDQEFRRVILEIVETFDGDRSSVDHKEIIRRARAEMSRAGKVDYAQPSRATSEYVSWLFKQRGHSTRAQRSNAIRGTSGKTHFPAIRPGQIVAIDATRADVLVWDPTHDRPMSVEIVTALDVASRCVLAARVVPKSADAIDAGLVLYDVMRPFHMTVAGTEMTHWRWAGVPERVDLTGTEVVHEHKSLAPAGTLQGDHHIPAVLPEGIRCDHGSIFVSNHFRALCHEFGIDLLLSRGRRPSDNAHGERIHLTYDRFYHQLPGYKGNNVAARGRSVEAEALYTAAELEAHLRRWVALDYHLTWHEGLTLPDAPKVRLTPIEMFDALLAASGRVDLPMPAQAIYQFLPVRWGTVDHDGIEFENLVYDARMLDDFRNVQKGQYRAKDRAMPFFYDPHDVSRVWWMDPDTEFVHEIPWRGRHLMDAPMTDAVLAAARKRITARGGNLVLNKDSTQRMILTELTELISTRPTTESRAMLSAAARRVETSEHDHAEAIQAQSHHSERSASNVRRLPQRADAGEGVSMLDDEWPDLEAGM